MLNKGETFKLKMCTILEKENNNKQNKTKEGDVKEEVRTQTRDESVSELIIT